MTDDLVPRKRPLSHAEAELLLMRYIVDPDTNPEDADEVLAQLRERFHEQKNDP